MAGKILPVALAGIAGISISLATFGGELRALRKKRLEEDYERDVAPVSSLNSEGPSPMAQSMIKPPEPALSLPKNEKTSKSESSSAFGLWAWKKSEDSKPIPTASESEAPQDKLAGIGERRR